jgi:AGCS family alanine or glycine:cation symporter
MENWARCLRELIWGWPVLGAILLAGANLSIRTGFFQITHCKFWIKNTIGNLFRGKKEGKADEKKGISSFQALTTALAGSIGTGNIVGVATALTLGGPGAIFWMWVSALLGMMTIWGETVLAVKYRVKDHSGQWAGGAMYYLERGVGSKGLAVLFSSACVLASLGMGNMAQSNSIAGALTDGFQIPPVATGAVLAVLFFILSSGGLRGTAKITEKLVPFMSLLYFAACGAVLVAFSDQIVPSLRLIVTEAFSLQAAAGGAGASVMLRAMQCGISRGIFTNEAGLGSAVMAYGGSTGDEPGKEGCWGILQVFIDTILMCTLTALCLLCTGVLESGKDGAALSTACFSALLGPFGKVFVCCAVTLFAFATMLAWNCYGQRALDYLTGGRGMALYRLAYCAACMLGCQMSLAAVWDLCDSFNGLMAIPNLVALFLLSGEIVAEKRKCLGQHPSRFSLKRTKNIQKKSRTLQTGEKAAAPAPDTPLSPNTPPRQNTLTVGPVRSR